MVPPALATFLRTLSRNRRPCPSRFPAGSPVLTVQSDDGGEDVGKRLRGVKLARLLAGPGGELADQIFIGIAQRIDVRGELRQAFGSQRSRSALLAVR